MKLDEAQKKIVVAWIEEGLKLSEIQNRIASELGLRLTYMDVRFLVDDLKVVPKDVEPPKAPTLPPTPPPASAPMAGLHPEKPASPAAPQSGAAVPGTGGVSISVDQLARPGAMVSGKVTFSDGNKADWYFDQTGRLGLVPQQTGYRPTPADVQQFQIALETEMSKMGF